MKIRTVISALALMLAVPAAWGQAAAGGAAPGAIKVGVINIQAAIGSTAEGKQAAAELQSQFAPRQNELENLNKQINDLRQQIAANQTTWSDDQKIKAQNQGQRLTAQFERKNNELNEDAQAAQGEVMDRIGRKMLDVLDRYSRENGYVVVLDTSSQNSPVLFASSAVDITQDIVKLYDQAYPIKASGTTPASKPATSTPKPAPTAKP